MLTKKRSSSFILFLLLAGVVLNPVAWSKYILPTFMKDNNRLQQNLSNISCPDCNVILVALDTLRADRLPCLGYKKETLKNLCEFADQSILFENHYVASSRTLPSHTSLFTSLLPNQHGVLTITKDRLSKDIVTLAEVLQANGYSTFWNGPLENPHLPLDRGIERGFENFEKEDTQFPFSSWKRTIDKSLNSSNKSFLFLHTYKIHTPYTPTYRESIELFSEGSNNEFLMTHDEFQEKLNKHLEEIVSRERSAADKEVSGQTQDMSNSPQRISEAFYRARWGDFGIQSRMHFTPGKKEYVNLTSSLYNASLYELDHEMKSLLEHLKSRGLLDNSIIILWSDHGEAFNEHGNGVEHGQDLYQELIRTPLIIHLPGSPAIRIKQNVSSLDIFPTILELVGIEIPDQALGKSFKSLLLGGTFPNEPRPIISERYHPDQGIGALQESIIFDEWKLILNYEDDKRSTPEELYNLSLDPGEQDNLIASRPEIAQRLSESLKKHKQQRKRFKRPTTEFPEWINEDTRKKLIETGYF